MLEFLPCDKRQKVVIFSKDGTQRRINSCAEEAAEAFRKEVTPEVCKDCPLREALMMKKIKTRGYQPPGFADRNKITSKRADTVPGPGWVPCVYRVFVTFRACCDATDSTRLCECPNAEYFGNEVAPEVCRKCPVRK